MFWTLLLKPIKTPAQKLELRLHCDQINDDDFLKMAFLSFYIAEPRSELPMFVEQFKEEIPDYMKKRLVKAGISGWAQVNGWREDTDLATRIEFDLYYIENWSLWLDLKIIFITIFKGFINKHAY